MKMLKLIGGACYTISFLFGANLFFKLFPGVSIDNTLIIFLIFGGLGFLLNLISYKKDKTGNPLSNLTYWLGSFAVFTGLLLKMTGTVYISIFTMSFPLSKFLIILGSVLLLYSFYLRRKRKIKKQDDEGILDQI